VNGRGDHCSGRDQNDVVSDSNTNVLATFEPASPLGPPRLRSRPVSQALHHLVPTISLSLSISTFFVSNFGNLLLCLLVGLKFQKVYMIFVMLTKRSSLIIVTHEEKLVDKLYLCSWFD
jgi:hypothetical protein